MAVPLLDLKAQYEQIRGEIEPAVNRVVESQGFILGPEVEALESEISAYLRVPHAVGCASGTDALLLALRALDPQPGDEVVLPTFTFFATAGAVWNAGFRPVFCDIDPDTFNVTRATIEAAWTPATRGVVAVHLFGQMAPMEEIGAFVNERGGFVIEDAAQAIGASQRAARSGRGDESEDEWTMAGAAGDAGAFSFFPTKNLGGFGDAGLISTVREDLAECTAKLRVHGGRQMYHHEMVGTNSRLDAIQAAVLRVKLPYLERWTAARRANACLYHGALAEIDEVVPPPTLDGNVHVFNQYTIRAARRDDLRAYLNERDIGSGVYYPVPLHLQACFEELGGRAGAFPEAERACGEVLSLPVFPELGESRLTTVTDTIREFYGR